MAVSKCAIMKFEALEACTKLEKVVVCNESRTL